MDLLPAAAADWAIFLDVDGTLVEIADHPDAVSPASCLPIILQELSAALGGAIALISGRRIASVDRLTGDTGLAIAGLHGLELRTADGCYQSTAEDSPQMTSARQRLQNFVDDHAGLYLEDKTATVALHYRGAPEAGAAALELGTEIAEQSDGQLELLAGKSVFELKPVDGDKGKAINTLLATLPFRGRRPVYVGDDVTDEYGFAAANDLDGISIRVGGNEQSAARYHLATVNEVLKWLRQVTATLAHPTHRPT